MWGLGGIDKRRPCTQREELRRFVYVCVCVCVCVWVGMYVCQERRGRRKVVAVEYN